MNKLMDFRTSLNLSRREAAEISGLTQTRIWKLEQDSTADAGSQTDGVTLMAALSAFQAENPDGKPSKSKKSPAKPSVKPDLEALIEAVNAKIELKKEAKLATGDLKDIVLRLEEIIAKA